MRLVPQGADGPGVTGGRGPAGGGRATASAPAPASARSSGSAASAAAKFAYNPALDGMRVLCIYIIIAGHMGAIRTSNVAVDVFMVLSGFLITTLLLAEYSRTGTISIGRFLTRRAYRLMPGMWFYLLVGVAVTVAFKWDDIPYRNDFFTSALAAFFNVFNWYLLDHVAAGGRWLPHTWSLSAEEQFYLVWPTLFLIVSRSKRLRPHLVTILIGLIVAEALFTYHTATQPGATHHHVYIALYNHLVPLLTGCLVAVWRDKRLRALAVAPAAAADNPSGPSRRRHSSAPGGTNAATAAAVERWTMGRRIAAFAPAAGITLLIFAFVGPNKGAHAANWLDKAAYVPSALLAAVIIIGADLRRDAAWVRLVGAPRMAFLGKFTYSIYLWHYPVISAAAGQLVPRIGLWPSVFVAIIVSTIMGYCSNRWIEKPLQARRPKWSDTPRGPARSAVPAPRPAPGVDPEDTNVFTVRRPRSAQSGRPVAPDPQWEEFDTAQLSYLDPQTPYSSRSVGAQASDRWNDGAGDDGGWDGYGRSEERVGAARVGADVRQADGPDEWVDEWVDEGYADARSTYRGGLDDGYDDGDGYAGSNGRTGADYAAVRWAEAASSEPAYTAELIYDPRAAAAARAEPYPAQGGWDQGYGRPPAHEALSAPDGWTGYEPGSGRDRPAPGEHRNDHDDWPAYPQTGDWTDHGAASSSERDRQVPAFGGSAGYEEMTGPDPRTGYRAPSGHAAQGGYPVEPGYAGYASQAGDDRAAGYGAAGAALVGHTGHPGQADPDGAARYEAPAAYDLQSAYQAQPRYDGPPGYDRPPRYDR